MSHNRLPVVPWQPTMCHIVPFPAKKRVGKIRRTAEILGGRQGKGADHYWQQVVTGLRSQMKKSGLAPAIIESELRGFADAVFAKLSSSRPNDGDAA